MEGAFPAGSVLLIVMLLMQEGGLLTAGTLRKEYLPPANHKLELLLHYITFSYAMLHSPQHTLLYLHVLLKS